MVCVTGVSGSGKTTLVREVLLPALESRLKSRKIAPRFAVKASDRIAEAPADPDEKEEKNANGDDSAPDADAAAEVPSAATRSQAVLAGWEHLGRAVLVDQSPLGKTPRSNPAVYIGAFDEIREIFARTDAARQRGLNASAFSFNSAQGQCERCRGAGFEKIEMQFLSDVFIRCPDCNGRRYRPHILEVKVRCPSSAARRPNRSANELTEHATRNTQHRAPGTERSLSIAGLLDSTVDESVAFLSGLPESPHAARAIARLELLREVGLGYLRLGQPINTLSGGESQRLKLVSHLAEAEAAAARGSAPSSVANTPPATPTLFLFDEPTTGLHFEDVRVLLKAFQRLVNAGHSVLVIEHNLDVIRSADWVIDLGPEAGDLGGRLVAQGTPADIARCEASHTGKALKEPAPVVIRSSHRQAHVRECV